MFNYLVETEYAILQLFSPILISEYAILQLFSSILKTEYAISLWFSPILKTEYAISLLFCCFGLFENEKSCLLTTLLSIFLFLHLLVHFLFP